MNILGYKSCCRSLMVALRSVPNGRITGQKFNYSFAKCISNTLLCASDVLSPWDREFFLHSLDNGILNNIPRLLYEERKPDFTILMV